MIRLFKVFMADDVDKFIIPVLSSGYIGEGDTVKEFEVAVGNYIGNNNVVAVNSGTSAIMMSLRMAGVGFGDCVISTPMTCLATNEPILALGARPIWSDIDERTGNILVDSVANILATSAIRPKAILCMHWGGYPCDLRKLNELACVCNIPVIEDAAQAFGSICERNYIGNHSDYVCFSFQAIKYLTTVDGGAIICNKPGDVDRARLMRWYGLDRTKSADMRCGQDPVEYGYKMHMNNLNAAVGLANIRHLPTLLDKVAMNARAYNEDLPRYTLPKINSDYHSCYWTYTIFVDDSTKFILYMASNGIECSQVHDRNDTKRMFIESRTALPGVDYFSSRHVCIPVGYWLSKEDVDHVIDTIRRY